MKKFYVRLCVKFETPVLVHDGNRTIGGLYAPRSIEAEDSDGAIKAAIAIVTEQLADKFPDTPDGFSGRIEIHGIEERTADFALANGHFDFIDE